MILTVEILRKRLVTLLSGVLLCAIRLLELVIILLIFFT